MSLTRHVDAASICNQPVEYLYARSQWCHEQWEATEETTEQEAVAAQAAAVAAAEEETAAQAAQASGSYKGVITRSA